jgi:CheY-like chemotaxis protein
MSEETDFLIEVIDELKDNNSDLEESLIKLNGNFDNDKEKSASFRHLHSLKGNSQLVGLQQLSSFCHRLEDQLNELTKDGEKFNKSFEYVIGFVEYVESYLNNRRENDSFDFDATFISNVLSNIDSVLSERQVEQKVCKVLGGEFHVVEDLDDIRETIVLCLEEEFSNSSVSSSEDGLEAMDICQSKLFDVIITDYKMPRMNGIEFIKKLRASDSINKKTPVIILTGFSPDYEPFSELWQNVFFLEKISDFSRLPFYVKAFLCQKKAA